MILYSKGYKGCSAGAAALSPYTAYLFHMSAYYKQSFIQ